MAVSIKTADEAVEVDLWGATFFTRRVTRSVAKALDAQQKSAQERAAAAGDDADPDDLMRSYAELLDVILAPEEGKRKKASAFVLEKWEGDEVTLDEVEAFIGRLAEASRPT